MIFYDGIDKIYDVIWYYDIVTSMQIYSWL